MNPYAAVGIILMFCALVSGAYLKGRSDEAAVAVEHERDALIEYAKTIVTAGEERAKNEQTIANLRTAANRVRVTFPVCQKTTNRDRASGALHSGVDDAFARLQTRVGVLIDRCDRLNIDAIESNSIR